MNYQLRLSELICCLSKVERNIQRYICHDKYKTVFVPTIGHNMTREFYWP